MASRSRIFLAIFLTTLCALSAEPTGGGGGSASSSSSTSSSSSGGGSASSSATASAGSGGSASAVSTATSQSFAASKSQLVVLVKQIFAALGSSAKTCAAGRLSVDVQVKNIGKVFAQALASTANIVEVQGPGSACGLSQASAQASSRALVGILAEVIAQLKNKVALAQAEAYLEVYSAVYAAAFAEAWSHACVDGEGSAFAFQDSLATALARPLTTIFVWIELGIDCTGSNPTLTAPRLDGAVEAGFSAVYAGALSAIKDESSTSSSSSSGITGSGSAGAGGTADATTTGIPPCQGLHSRCCGITSKKCFCGSRTLKFCDLHVKADDGIWFGRRDRPFCFCA